MGFGNMAEINTNLMNREAKNKQMRYILSQKEDKNLTEIDQDRAIRLVSLYEKFGRFSFDNVFLDHEKPKEEQSDG
jgi:hypothetical protein